MTTAVNPYESLGIAQPVPAASKQVLGQEDFLKLMTTQLQSQDPFKPMDSAQFLGQIAQFSTVSGIQSLNTGFASLTDSLTANQALQGATLVGRQVQLAGDVLAVTDTGTAAGSARLPVSGEVSLTIRNAAGVTVRQIDLGPQGAGDLPFTWDGNTVDGVHAPAGQYSVTATLTKADGSQEALATEVIAPVTAVRIGAQGLQVEVAGSATVPLSAIRQIR